MKTTLSLSDFKSKNNITTKVKTINAQFGCGLFAPEGWLNYDVSPTLRLRKIPLLGQLMPAGQYGNFPKNVLYGNIIKGLPLAANSVDNLYCSHVLEHLALEDFRTSLKHCYKILKPEGTFRFVLPDLEYMARQYIHSEKDTASLDFMKMTYLGREKRAKGLMGFLREWLGNSKHLWMWDFKSIKKELEAVGFQSIRRAYYNDSSELAFRDVEEFRRWDKELGVECKK